MVRIGLLGCGNVGRIIATHQDGFTVEALFDRLPDHAEELARMCGAPAYADFQEFISQDFDICVEAASVLAVREYAPKILENGKHVLILSVGALSDTNFRKILLDVARSQGKKIHIPSGAIMGLDNLKVGGISRIDSVLLRTTKSPASLGMQVSHRTLAFRGKANECIKQFPKNINVSVALALAVHHDVDVELWADPEVDRNIHDIFVSGEFGEASIRVVNHPSPDNPATSYLAALSVLSLLKNLDSPLVIGS
ncbi:aspartate dehydrogenase [Methanospirillum hungatei JF-1]|uniref:L-aspartate dehydrogenase n=1 Tax=Methanospirillum hungatei JF-1 (strain ATCC 27890 / DSM 864 / NBRC 100397 / JF-1) TaxID=323259 RepID=ASPD_METHJ|nr:aspartate dehydrogenase [Methanospirillum hungatei]Q2FSK9.1 RecName: Full=L-aspartate dehydrogenase [Methanospirillum hungatei JF-1]ABD42058.1 aspartate dehydrogenase [Methanospirillum hungatei JF-1]